MSALAVSLGVGLIAAAGFLVVFWPVSLLRRDASIVDILWGPVFVVLAWVYRAIEGQPDVGRARLIPWLVTLWGLRLALHIFLRSRGQGEDFRYRAMRETHGERFGFVSLFTVFLLQAVLAWFVALPLLQVQRNSAPSGLTGLDLFALAVFAVGFLFETVGDLQLTRFRARPDNRGKVLDSGLWRYTRHPNYFGDAVVWWGLGLFALGTPHGWWTLAGPALMTVLLLEVSGVSLLESTLRETKPRYSDYVARTPAFFPWFPRPQPKPHE